MMRNVKTNSSHLMLRSLRGLTGRPLLFGAGLASIAVLAVLFVAQQAGGQEAPGRGLSISPLTFEFRVDPGQEVSDEVRVFNSGTEPIFASIQIEDTTPTGERGQAVIGEAGSTTYSIATWTEVESEVVEVQPGEQRVIPFTLRVPENAEPGGHYGALTVENLPGGIDSGGAGVTFAQKVAALMLVNVSGDVEEELTLTDFFISVEQTKFRYDWIPTNWILDPENVTFVLRFENTGSVHEKPAGFVTVTNSLGNELAKIPLDQRNVLPGSARILEIEWQPEALTIGKIRAEVNAIYGSRNEPLFGAAEFWVVPVATLGPWVIGILVALILGFLLRKRLALAFRVIIKGDASSSPKPKKRGKREEAGGKSDDDSNNNPPPPSAPPAQPPSRPTVT